MQSLSQTPRNRLFRVALATGIAAVMSASLWAADDPVRVAAKDASGREIFVVEQTYSGKKPLDPRTRLPHSPDDVDTDFYKITYRNVSDQPIAVKRFASGLRYGTGTIVGQKDAEGREAWGNGLKPRDLTAQPMFNKNILAPGASITSEGFIYGRTSPNYMDRVIEIDHAGTPHELKWEMRYQRGTMFR